MNKDSAGLLNNWSHSAELSPIDWGVIMDKLKISNIRINGVEPLLYNRLDELLEILSKNRTLSLLTNGFLVDKWFDVLIRYLNRIILSVDGYNSNTHDSIRGIGGAHKKVINAIKRFKKESISVQVNYSVLPINTNEIINFYNYMKELNVDRIVFNHFIHISDSSAKKYNFKGSNIDFFNPKDINSFELINAVKFCPDAKWSPFLKTIDEINYYYKFDPIDRKKGTCKGIKSQLKSTKFVLNSSGDFLPSHNCWIDKSIGNVLKNDSRPPDVKWLSDLLSDYNFNGLPEPCQRLCCAELNSYTEE